MIHSTNENCCLLFWLSAVLPFEGLHLFNMIFCSKCEVWSFTCREESISAASQQGLDSRGGTNLYVNEGSAGAPCGFLYYFKCCFEILIWHSLEAAFIKRVMSSGSLAESEAWVLLEFWCFDPSRKHCQFWAVTLINESECHDSDDTVCTSKFPYLNTPTWNLFRSTCN